MLQRYAAHELVGGSLTCCEDGDAWVAKSREVEDAGGGLDGCDHGGEVGY